MATRVDKILELQSKPQNIRCIAVIAHVDHGKTTLSDALLAKAGLIKEDQSGTRCELDTLPDEKERGITIKSTAVSMCFDNPVDKESYLINLIDSPGHVDFSSEVTAALRVSDGAIVVVDCVEGVCVQTETVLRQALTERVKPVLVINKLDRMIVELQQDPEEAYRRLDQAIIGVNASMSPFKDESLGDIDFSPEKGNVLFGTGLFGWGFTLHQWARLIQRIQGGSFDKIVKRLWGDHFWDAETKQFYDVPVSPSGQKLERYACKMMLGPVFKMVRAVLKEDWAEIDKLATTFCLVLNTEERQRHGKDLMRCVMKKLAHIGDGLVELVSMHLPSPVEAQKYRVECLYEGPLDDEVAKGIRNCDPAGPLCVYISKMVPGGTNRQFYAFGRIFSGTLNVGQRVFVMDPNNETAKSEKSVPAVFVMMGKGAQRVEQVRCGNTVAVMGMDQALLKNGTLTSVKSGFPIKAMKFTVSPVVRVAISPKSPSDLPKLVEGLRLFSKSDQCVTVTCENTGEHIIGCVGELHLEVSLSVLRRDYCKGIEIVVSEPVVPLQETVLQTSSQICLAKSPNKHNRFYATAEPLPEELCLEIEQRQSFFLKDSVARSSLLVDQYSWDSDIAKKHIWCFGPEVHPVNALVDTTKGIQYLNETKDSACAAFQWATGEGPLAGEEVRGVRVNIVDVSLHGDAIHRGGGQVIPPVRRLVHACVVSAAPRLVEPVFLVEIATTQAQASAVYAIIAERHGTPVGIDTRDGTPIVTIKAHIPVLFTFGLVEALRQASHGQAFPQCIMDHWQIVRSDPYEEGSRAHQLVQKIRARKGLAPPLPKLSDLVDIL